MTDSTGPARSRRRHPALGARIAATGISTAAMFGIVAALAAQTPVAPEPVVTGQPVAAAGVSTVTRSVAADPAVSTPRRVEVSELSGQPVQLTANPVVRAASPGRAAAPVARTNGSR